MSPKPFVPFARKYRPQTFEQLIGQPHVAGTLRRALASGRLAQAYLFAGQRGIGKTSAARILAKCLNCERGPIATPCNACANCSGITVGNSLDVTEIDGASNRGIDEIRSLRETVGYAPTTGRFHVYIIDEVHMLTAEAFNALLKTLEEPPGHVKFVFATTAVNKVPPTILSRCQRFDFRRLEVGTIVEALRPIAKAEQLKLEESAAYAVARAAEGSLRDAEVICEQLASFVEGPIREEDVTALLGLVDSEILGAWTDAILRRDASLALVLLTQQLERGREPAQLLTGLLRHLRNLLILCSATPDASQQPLVARLVDEPPERVEGLREQAGRTTAQELLVFLQILTSAYELVRRSPMAQTVLELVIIKLATREQWQSLEEISQRLESLRAGQGASSAGRPPAAQPGGREARGESPAGRVAASPTRGQTTPTADVAQMGAPDELLAQWPTFLERLASEKMSLAAYLADSKPMELAEGTLTVGLPGFALHQEVLATDEHRRLIERLLEEFCHSRVRIAYATLPEPAEPFHAAAPHGGAQEATPPIVQDIVKLFNAKILDRPPQTT